MLLIISLFVLIGLTLSAKKDAPKVPSDRAQLFQFIAAIFANYNEENGNSLITNKKKCVNFIRPEECPYLNPLMKVYYLYSVQRVIFPEIVNIVINEIGVDNIEIFRGLINEFNEINAILAIANEHRYFHKTPKINDKVQKAVNVLINALDDWTFNLLSPSAMEVNIFNIEQNNENVEHKIKDILAEYSHDPIARIKILFLHGIAAYYIANFKFKATWKEFLLSEHFQYVKLTSVLSRPEVYFIAEHYKKGFFDKAIRSIYNQQSEESHHFLKYILSLLTGDIDLVNSGLSNLNDEYNESWGIDYLPPPEEMNVLKSSQLTQMKSFSKFSPKEFHKTLFSLKTDWTHRFRTVVNMYKYLIRDVIVPIIVKHRPKKEETPKEPSKGKAVFDTLFGWMTRKRESLGRCDELLLENEADFNLLHNLYNLPYITDVEHHRSDFSLIDGSLYSLSLLFKPQQENPNVNTIGFLLNLINSTNILQEFVNFTIMHHGEEGSITSSLYEVTEFKASDFSSSFEKQKPIEKEPMEELNIEEQKVVSDLQKLPKGAEIELQTIEEDNGSSIDSSVSDHGEYDLDVDDPKPQIARESILKPQRPSVNRTGSETSSNEDQLVSLSLSPKKRRSLSLNDNLPKSTQSEKFQKDSYFEAEDDEQNTPLLPKESLKSKSQIQWVKNHSLLFNGNYAQFDLPYYLEFLPILYYFQSVGDEGSIDHLTNSISDLWDTIVHFYQIIGDREDGEVLLDCYEGLLRRLILTQSQYDLLRYKLRDEI